MYHKPILLEMPIKKLHLVRINIITYANLSTHIHVFFFFFLGGGGGGRLKRPKEGKESYMNIMNKTQY